MNRTALTGTPKQIEWATALRAKAIKTVEDFAAKKGIKTSSVDEVLTAINEQTSAEWWIDNREIVGNVRHILARLGAERRQQD